MGRRNKQYSKDLKQQIQYKLEGMLKAGEGTSKKEAILTDSTRDKIFSYSRSNNIMIMTLYIISRQKSSGVPPLAITIRLLRSLTLSVDVNLLSLTALY